MVFSVRSIACSAVFLLAFEACNTEAALQGQLSEETVSHTEIYIDATEGKTETIEEKVQVDFGEDTHDKSPDETFTPASPNVDMQAEQEEAEHNLELEIAAHEHDEAMIRAQQLYDQAQYEMDRASFNLDDKHATPEDSYRQAAQDANAKASVALEEANAEMKSIEEFSSEQRRRLIERL